jgi:hypothetical protein
MTTTRQPQEQLAFRDGGISHIGWAACLALGAILTAAALSMHVKGSEDATEAEIVAAIARAPEVWLIGHVLMGVGGILLLVGLLAVPRLVRGRGRRIVALAAGTTGVGAAATALSDFSHGSLAYVLLSEVSDERSVQIQELYFTQPILGAISMLGMLLPAGMLALGAALLYSRAVPIAVGLLVLIAPIAVQVSFNVHALPMFVMVIPLVVGMGWLSILLTSRSRPSGSDRAVEVGAERA